MLNVIKKSEQVDYQRMWEIELNKCKKLTSDIENLKKTDFSSVDETIDSSNNEFLNSYLNKKIIDSICDVIYEIGINKNYDEFFIEKINKKFEEVNNLGKFSISILHNFNTILQNVKSMHKTISGEIEQYEKQKANQLKKNQNTILDSLNFERMTYQAIKINLILEKKYIDCKIMKSKLLTNNNEILKSTKKNANDINDNADVRYFLSLEKSRQEYKIYKKFESKLHDCLKNAKAIEVFAEINNIAEKIKNTTHEIIGLIKKSTGVSDKNISNFYFLKSLNQFLEIVSSNNIIQLENCTSIATYIIDEFFMTANSTKLAYYLKIVTLQNYNLASACSILKNQHWQCNDVKHLQKQLQSITIPKTIKIRSLEEDIGEKKIEIIKEMSFSV